MIDTAFRTELLFEMFDIALHAGSVVHEYFGKEIEVAVKADDSPVTAADHAAEAIILERLVRAAPGFPVVAEEEAAAGRIPEVGEAFFLVDPLDGTRAFAAKDKDFTVNIALIVNGRPTLGVVYAPAHGRVFAGAVDDKVAFQAFPEPGGRVPLWQRPMQVRTPQAGWTVAVSKTHGNPATERYLATVPMGERLEVSSSLKFCLIAAGEADLYPRASPTMEWDTAAGHAVLRGAGGRVMGPDGLPLRYGKPRFYNAGFVASGPFDPPPIGPHIG